MLRPFWAVHLIYRKAWLTWWVRLCWHDTDTNSSCYSGMPPLPGTMQLVRHINLRELPDIYVFYYCPRCQHVETVK
jgi:hypothetical protein